MYSIDDAATEIVGEAVAVGKSLLQWARSHPEADLLALEERVREEGLGLLTLLLKLVLEMQQTLEAAPACDHCGQTTERHGWRPRAVQTLSGLVRIPLLRFRCAACQREVPGAIRRRLRCGCTPLLAERVASLGAGLPSFRRAERELAGWGVQLSDNTVTELTGQVGGALAAAEEQEAERVATGELELAPPLAPERLYVEADAFKFRARDGWHDINVGCCFETPQCPPDANGRPPHPQRLSCRATWTEAAGFDRRFYPEVQRRGVNQAAEVITLVDGMPWLREHLKAYLPPGQPLVEILDWYHATENLAKAVRAVYPTDPDAFGAAFARLKGDLWEGRASRVVRQLHAWRTAAPAAVAAELLTVSRYLWSNRSRMRYQRLRAAGYLIGSGQIESLCKQLGARVKGADRRWTRPHLEAVLTIRCQQITADHQRPRAA